LIVAIDSSVLLYLIDPNLPAPSDADGKRIDRCQERVEFLLDTMSKNGDTLVIPSPALAEVLTNAGDVGSDWLSTLHGKRAIRIASFDEMAAIECAELARQRTKRARLSSRNKSKFDEQIVAIAAVSRAERILSDDADIRRLAPSSLTVLGIGDLELPPEDPQTDMFLKD